MSSHDRRQVQVREALRHGSGVGRLVLGGPFGERSDAASCEILDHFVAAGGRLVETAHAYAGGAAECQVGRWRRAAPSEVVCITKVGHPAPGSDRVDVDALAGQIRLSAERLAVDRLDVVLLHRDDPTVAVADLLAPLLSAAREGIVCAVGVANWQAARMAQAQAVGAGVGLALASSHVSLAVPECPVWPGVVNADRDLLEFHARGALPLLSWSANARGWFAGTLRDADDFEDQPSRRAFATALNRRRRDACTVLAGRLGVRSAVIALAWTLMTYPFVLPAVGPLSVEELDDALQAARLALSSSDLAALTEEAHARDRPGP